MRQHGSMDTRQAAIGSVVFFFVAPFLVAGVGPWLIGRATDTSVAWPVQVLGMLVGLAGLGALLGCFSAFVAARGTPAPVAPTRRLVVEGLYRFVRNPMYVAVLAMILGQALWHGSLWVLAYGVLVWAVVAMFVRFYEEPTLVRQFGPDYETYRAGVPAWLPRLRPWVAPGDATRA